MNNGRLQFSCQREQSELAQTLPSAAENLTGRVKFFNLVKAMREAQREYFSTRSHEALQKARSLTWYWRLSAKQSTWIISLITTIKNQKTMKKYIGTKTIMAKPMAKSEAEKVLNRSLADEKGGEDYLKRQNQEPILFDND